jgi:hypothetical protein
MLSVNAAGGYSAIAIRFQFVGGIISMVGRAFFSGVYAFDWQKAGPLLTAQTTPPPCSLIRSLRTNRKHSTIPVNTYHRVLGTGNFGLRELRLREGYLPLLSVINLTSSAESAWIVISPELIAH